MDANTGWICGSDGKISKTTDGGTSWTEYSTPFSNTILEICFINNTTGWAVSTEGISKTTDGGKTWAIQYTPKILYEPKSLYFIDTNTGWAAGNYGLMLHTTDGGNTWTEQSTPIKKGNYFYDVFFCKRKFRLCSW